jgi:hypothetical protein
MSSTPSLPTPPRPCLTCTTPTTNTGQRCNTCTPIKNKQHNKNTAYYSSKEWRRLRDACKAEAHHQCCTCAGTQRLMAHHIIARKDGGVDALHNLACLCIKCHSKLEAGDKRTIALLNEYLRIRPNN